MIERATFRNFKCLAEVDIGFEPLTVIVGPNASGKTSVLQGLDLLTRAANKPDKLESEVFVGDWDVETIRNCNTADEMELCREDHGIRLRLATARPSGRSDSATSPANGRQRTMSLSWQASGQPDSPWQPFKTVPWPPTKTAPTPGHFTSTVLLRLSTDQLARPSFSESTTPTIASDGFGLATMLAFVRLNRPEVFSRIEEGLRQVVPAVRRIRFDRVTTVGSSSGFGGNQPTQSGVRDRLLIDMRQANGVPANHVSEGTLLALGVISVLLESQAPACVLLDDIHNALHPRAQQEFVGVIRQILKMSPKVQVIATTHSPYLVDQLAPEEIRLMSTRDDGTTACARLDEHPDFEKWKDEMAPGEFWSSVGEKWVADREAAGATP